MRRRQQSSWSVVLVAGVMIAAAACSAAPPTSLAPTSAPRLEPTIQAAVHATMQAQATPSAVAATPAMLPSATVSSSNHIRAAFESIVRIQTERGQGTGFAVARPGGGLGVMTNGHVIEGAATIRVIAPDGEAWPVAFVARDPLVDLVVLTAPGLALPPLPLAESEPDVADTVIAVGFPLGELLKGEPTVTRGVISSRRQINNVTYLQIDAAINPGNSGGPVLDERGAVLGVATMKIEGAEGTVAEGLGFAIPARRVQVLLASAPPPIAIGALARSAQPSAPTTAPERPPAPAQNLPERAPAGVGEWTVILSSLPVAEGKTRQDAEQEAADVRAQGYRAGVLLSDDYSSLRPGYWVVYSRLFAASGDAQAYADHLQAVGFPVAYPRLLWQDAEARPPPGVGEWTVILASLSVAEGKTRQDAEVAAAEASAHGYQAGVLLSDDYQSLRSGYWVVYSRLFRGAEEAGDYANQLKEAGYTTAYPRLLQR